MTNITSDKSFGTALLLWFLAGAVGAHRIYMQEKISIIFWYWLLSAITFGLAPLIDVFLIKGKIHEINNSRRFQQDVVELKNQMKYKQQ